MKKQNTMEITISGKDRKLLEQLETLAKRLGLKINKPLKKEKMQEKTNAENLHKLMKEAASRGDLFKSIPDPVAWQREQRC
ncbi:MAG: hypothetical protein ABR595_08320 [Psychroflexus sp.]